MYTIGRRARRCACYHCHGDQDVVYANSEVAYGQFISNGASQVQLMNYFPQGNHATGLLPCLLGGKAWFDSLKQYLERELDDSFLNLLCPAGDVTKNPIIVPGVRAAGRGRVRPSRPQGRIPRRC